MARATTATCTQSLPTASRGFAAGWLLATLWIVLLLPAAWRLALAAGAALHPTPEIVQPAIVVHWRALDQFTGWSVLLIFALTGCDGRAAGARLWSCIVGGGVLLLCAAIAWDQWDGLGWARSSWPNPAALIGIGERLGLLADLWLAATGAALAVRELAGLVHEAHAAAGVTIIQLWRLLATQWIVAWLAALVFLRLTRSTDDFLGNEVLRHLLFTLPGLAVLPNVLMSGGLRWWGALYRPIARDAGPSRMRAWLLAAAAVNVGAVMLLIRPAWIGVGGTAFMVFGIAMYLLGFPRGAWGSRRAAATIWAGFAALALALLMAAAERLASLAVQPPNVFYSGAWRHLAGVGVPLLWLCGFGQMALRCRVDAALRPTGAAWGVTLCILAGVVTSTALLLAAGHGEPLGPLSVLVYGALLEALGIAVAGPVLLRSMRLTARKEPTS